ASEPSQFLNEMPLELIEDLSRGRSWLSFARGSTAVQADAQLASHRETKSRSRYEGKTYDSAESIQEFFQRRSAQLGHPAPARHQPRARSAAASSSDQSGPAAAAV